jgi:hypothetical protein
MDYFQKYMKYKSKYFTLTGGTKPNRPQSASGVQRPPRELSRGHVTSTGRGSTDSAPAPAPVATVTPASTLSASASAPALALAPAAGSGARAVAAIGQKTKTRDSRIQFPLINKHIQQDESREYIINLLKVNALKSTSEFSGFTLLDLAHLHNLLPISHSPDDIYSLDTLLKMIPSFNKKISAPVSAPSAQSAQGEAFQPNSRTQRPNMGLPGYPDYISNNSIVDIHNYISLNSPFIVRFCLNTASTLPDKDSVLPDVDKEYLYLAISYALDISNTPSDILTADISKYKPFSPLYILYLMLKKTSSIVFIAHRVQKLLELNYNSGRSSEIISIINGWKKANEKTGDKNEADEVAIDDYKALTDWLIFLFVDNTRDMVVTLLTKRILKTQLSNDDTKKALEEFISTTISSVDMDRDLLSKCPYKFKDPDISKILQNMNLPITKQHTETPTKKLRNARDQDRDTDD